ncbi:GNAT family N-acetyltransferase [Dendrosporobacter sp. 1207_IL3150]|uniref:GNAT family N-acetyltransferase n=1 Tax=Dendrosporobacter sp. 1207_IL3150 TaxID=3084054 RepID=UPI002FDAAE17
MSCQTLIDRANPSDIPAIAAVFTESFKESVLHHCGRLPKPQAMQDVFTLVYEAEPEAALVARNEAGEVVGYCFAPTALPKLWSTAVMGGHIFKWAWRWLTGKYGFGLYPVKVIVLNKLSFLGSSFVPSKSANARILSIAVSEVCRGQGIASKLMNEALIYFSQRKANRVRLEVRPDNAAAIKVYDRMGFYPGGYTTDSQGQWLIMFKEMEQK